MSIEFAFIDYDRFSDLQWLPVDQNSAHILYNYIDRELYRYYGEKATKCKYRLSENMMTPNGFAINVETFKDHLMLNFFDVSNVHDENPVVVQSLIDNEFYLMEYSDDWGITQIKI